MAGGFVRNQGCLASEEEMQAWSKEKETLKGGNRMIYAYSEEVGGKVKVIARDDRPTIFSDLLKSGPQNGVTPRLLKGMNEEIFELMSLDEIRRKGLLVEDPIGEISSWRNNGLKNGEQMETAVDQMIAAGTIIV